VELADKLEAAFVKYLQTLHPSPFPAYFDKAAQIKPGENDEDLDNQYLRAVADVQAESEFPIGTGNFWWPMELEVRTPARLQTPAEEASADPAESTSQLDKHKAIATILENALLADTLPALVMAAAAVLGAAYQFTIFGIQDLKPGRVQLDDVYSSSWTLRVYCCAASL